MTKAKLKTIDIKGKPYVMVKDKVLAFNEENEKGAIITEITSSNEKSVCMKATVYPDANNNLRFFTGHSEAHRTGNMGAVAVEVAETSAIGRALSAMGYGIVESYASADEIHKAEGSRMPLNAPTTQDTPKSGKRCSLCNADALISPKSGKPYCPNWAKHKEEGQFAQMLDPIDPESVSKLSDNVQEFVNGLEEIKYD